MTKEQWMEAWERVAARDKIAARLMVVLRVLVGGESVDREVKRTLLALAFECSVERMDQAHMVLAEEGLGTIEWLQ
ncbi:MAG: hypothetical protein ACRDTR_04265 [Rubrobacter sp.]